MKLDKTVTFSPILALGALFLCFISGCVTTQPKLEGPKLRIAVPDFANHSRNHGNSLGDFFADRMTHELFRFQRFKLVERGEVNAALALEKIDQPSDELSTEEIRRIGKRLGADALILGEITEYQTGDFETGPSRVGVLVRLVSCKDGALLGMERTRAKAGKGDLVVLSEKAVAKAAGALSRPLCQAEKALCASNEPRDSLAMPLGLRKDK
jgi:TolB-like protein